MTPEEWREEYGFELANSHHSTVECRICGRQGAGLVGSGPEFIATLYKMWSRYWQRRCLHPHIYECACGVFFPASQPLGIHVAQSRRWNNGGHGRMDQVGWQRVSYAQPGPEKRA